MDQKLRMGLGWPTMAVVLTCAVAVMLPGVSSTRYVVGANMGWTSNVNYTVWARAKHFHRGDWLYFVYDRNRMNVLEVKKSRAILGIPFTTGQVDMKETWFHLT